MRRYGWQARQARLNNKSQTDSNFSQPLNTKQNLNTSRTHLNHSKNISNVYSQSQKKGFITKISQISQNPLFQGMDMYSNKKNQQQNSYIKINQIAKRYNVQPSKKDFVNNNQLQNCQKKILQKKLQENANKQFSSIIAVEQSKKFNEPPHEIKDRIEKNDEQFVLQFKKRDKMSESVKLMQKLPLAQMHQIKNQLKNKNHNSIYFNGNRSMTAQSKTYQRNKLLTQRKKYDLIDDVLFGNFSRKDNNAESQRKSINFKTALELQISPISKKFQNQSQQKSISTQNRQIRNLYNEIEQIKYKKFQQKNQILFNQKFQQTYSLNKISKIQNKKQSKIIVFNLVNILKNFQKNMYQLFVTKVKSTYKKNVYKKINQLLKINQLNRIYKNYQKRTILQIFLLMKNNAVNKSIKNQKNIKMANINKKNLLMIKINKLFRQNMSYFLNCLQKNNQRHKIILKVMQILQTKFIGNKIKKIFVQLKNYKNNKDRYKQSAYKNISKYIKILINQKVKQSFYNIMLYGYFQRKQQKQLNFISPKANKNEVTMQIINSEPNKKQPLTQKEKKNAIPIGKTAMNTTETQSLRLQKQLKVLQKNQKQQITNLQLRIEQLKQILRQQNFQISYKKQKVIQRENIIKENYQNDYLTIQAQNNKYVICNTKFQILAKVYIYLRKLKEIDQQGNEVIDLERLQKFIEASNQQQRNQQLIKWLLFYKNKEIKKQIDYFEEKIIKKLPPEILDRGQIQQKQKQKRKRILCQSYAQKQQQILQSYIKNYIQEKYEWKRVTNFINKQF